MKILSLLPLLFPLVTQADFWCDLGNRPSVTIPRNPAGMMYRQIQVDYMGPNQIQIDFRDNYYEVHEVMTLGWVEGSSAQSIAGIRMGSYKDDSGKLRAVFSISDKGFVQFLKDDETALNICDTL